MPSPVKRRAAPGVSPSPVTCASGRGCDRRQVEAAARTIPARAVSTSRELWLAIHLPHYMLESLRWREANAGAAEARSPGSQRRRRPRRRRQGRLRLRRRAAAAGITCGMAINSALALLPRSTCGRATSPKSARCSKPLPRSQSGLLRASRSSRPMRCCSRCAAASGCSAACGGCCARARADAVAGRRAAARARTNAAGIALVCADWHGGRVAQAGRAREPPCAAAARLRALAGDEPAVARHHGRAHDRRLPEAAAGRILAPVCAADAACARPRGWP